MNVHEAVALVSRERIESHYKALAEIGIDPKGGYTRLAYSDEENQAHKYLGQEMKKVGLKVNCDHIGNLFGITQETDQFILSGSHLDSVKTGGNADGVGGCIAALEALTCFSYLNAELRYALGCCAIRAEESDRFGQALIGSKGIFQHLSEKEFSSKDESGKTLYDAIKECGFSPDGGIRFSTSRIRCFIELHVEQSYILEEEGKPIGIVERIAAPERWKITVYGKRDHSGATPMSKRYDANQGMAEMMNSVEEIASENPPLVATVGRCGDMGGSINTISGQAYFYMDCRDVDVDRRSTRIRKIMQRIKEIAKKRDLTVEQEQISSSKPISLDPQVIEALTKSCTDLGVDYRLMNSGASHDAATFAANGVPNGMIFIPSINGISHAPEEEINIDDLVKGTQVLFVSMLQLAEMGDDK